MSNIPVFIHYSDGQYSITRTDQEDTKGWPTHGYVSEEEWIDYEQLLEHLAAWRHKITTMDNAYHKLKNKFERRSDEPA